MRYGRHGPALLAGALMALAPPFRAAVADEYWRDLDADRYRGPYKSKGEPTKRKLKRNRLHVSRRVRRKHRREA